MKKVFVDLHLCPNVKNSEQLLLLLRKVSSFGYKLVAFSFPFDCTAEEIERVKGLGSEVGVDVVSRVDLKPQSSKELLYRLRNYRRKFEIIAVLCESKNVARQAAKDRRVDLLNFPLVDFRQRFFDRSEAELASKGLASFEVDVKPLLVLEGAARVRLLASLRREVQVALKFGVPVVVSSGVSDLWLLRLPRDVAVLCSLFGLDEVSALKSVSDVPLAIVRRNREKLGSGFVAPGIRVVRRGKDC